MRLLIAFTLLLQLNFHSFTQSVSENPNSNLNTNFRFSLDYGTGIRFIQVDNSISDTLVNHLTKLKKGKNLGFDFTYFFNKQSTLGIGFCFSQFISNANTNDAILFGEYQYPIAIGLDDKIKMNFFGIGFYYRYYLLKNKSLVLVPALIPGYLKYQQLRNWGQYKFDISGKTYGIKTALAIEYMLTKNIGIGANISVLGSYLKKITTKTEIEKVINEFSETTNLPNKESLSRFNMNFGIRICN